MRCFRFPQRQRMRHRCADLSAVPESSTMAPTRTLARASMTATALLLVVATTAGVLASLPGAQAAFCHGKPSPDAQPNLFPIISPSAVLVCCVTRVVSAHVCMCACGRWALGVRRWVLGVGR